MFCYSNIDQYFTVKFGLNRMVYKILMNTMKWVEEHRIFEILINSQKYNQIDHSIAESLGDQSFNCPLTNALNYEQKLAVQHIVFGHNIEIPMLLHGPPGKFQMIL